MEHLRRYAGESHAIGPLGGAIVRHNGKRGRSEERPLSGPHGPHNFGNLPGASPLQTISKRSCEPLGLPALKTIDAACASPLILVRWCPFGSPPRRRPVAEFGLFLREDRGSTDRCSLIFSLPRLGYTIRPILPPLS